MGRKKRNPNDEQLERLLADVDVNARHPQPMSMAELAAIEEGRIKNGQWPRDNAADQRCIEDQLIRVSRNESRAWHDAKRHAELTGRSDLIEVVEWAKQYYTASELRAIAESDDAIRDLYDAYLDAHR